MTTRVLGSEDWPILAETDLGRVLPLLEPAANEIRVVATFDETGELAGCWAALRMVHLEGVWVAPAHRGKAAVARQLRAAMRDVGATWGVTSALTAADTTAIEMLIRRHGGHALPATFVLPLGKG